MSSRIPLRDYVEAFRYLARRTKFTFHPWQWPWMTVSVVRMYTPSERVKNQIEKSFVYHPVKEGQQERYVKIRDTARDLAYVIVGNSPESREQSLALTKLEEAVMHANAAIARNE